jgi:ankyrin repeat protein
MVVVARRWIAKPVCGRWTALHVAASGGAEQAYSRRTLVELVELLIDAGADVDAKDNRG